MAVSVIWTEGQWWWQCDCRYRINPVFQVLFMVSYSVVNKERVFDVLILYSRKLLSGIPVTIINFYY